jgi:hypothetical protein
MGANCVTKIRTDLQAHEKKGVELPVGVDEEMGEVQSSMMRRLARFLNEEQLGESRDCRI